MSKFEKLLSRIMSLDKGMRFNELKKILESFGYTMTAPRGGSSHYTFRKAGCNPITIPKHEPLTYSLHLIPSVFEVGDSRIQTSLAFPASRT